MDSANAVTRMDGKLQVNLVSDEEDVTDRMNSYLPSFNYGSMKRCALLSACFTVAAGGCLGFSRPQQSRLA
jgi:hypothetical protein